MTPDPDFVELTTRRLRIRRFRPEDATIFAAYRADPEIARYQSWESYTVSRAVRFIDEIADASPGTQGEGFQFAVADRESDRLLGDVFLRVLDDQPERAELGFTSAREAQGHGYATEAVERVIAYAFGPLDLRVVFATPDARNAKSIALLERIGMRRVSTDRAWFKGEWCDERTYELERREP